MVDVKKIRELYGLTQQDMADKCGVSSRTIQNWEMGKKIPESAMKLLQTFVAEHESISPAIQANSADSPVEIRSGTSETEKFISALERQQELMFRQLDIIERRDEQIDRLIKLLEDR
jgi:transcriptional regulator with XRE-family HTH domain